MKPYVMSDAVKKAIAAALAVYPAVPSDDPYDCPVDDYRRLVKMFTGPFIITVERSEPFPEESAS